MDDCLLFREFFFFSNKKGRESDDDDDDSLVWKGVLVGKEIITSEAERASLAESRTHAAKRRARLPQVVVSHRVDIRGIGEDGDTAVVTCCPPRSGISNASLGCALYFPLPHSNKPPNKRNVSPVHGFPID